MPNDTVPVEVTQADRDARELFRILKLIASDHGHLHEGEALYAIKHALSPRPVSTGEEVERSASFEARKVAAAANIFDFWMGGDKSWRHEIDETDITGAGILQSADWLMAMQYADIVLSTPLSAALSSDRPSPVEGE